MYLKKICVRNFRVFDDKGIEVEFKQGVNAIIGANNCGKSALIDAIRIAFSAIQYRKDIFFSKSDFHISKQGKQAKNSQIDIYLEDVPKSLIEIWNPENEYPDTGEFHLQFYSETTPTGYEKIKYKAWGGKTEGNPLSTDTFDAMNIAFLGALRDAESEMKPSRTSKLANLLASVADSEDKRIAFVTKLKNANMAILKMEPIQRTKEIINKNLSDIEQDIFMQQVDIGLVEPRFESISSSLRSWIIPRWHLIMSDFPHLEKIKTYCKEKQFATLIDTTSEGVYVDINGLLNTSIDFSEDEKSSLLELMQHSFELYQNGLGYNNLLFMSAVLGDMSLSKGVFLNLFAIEEPEAHLHPQLQELVHSFFERSHIKDSSSIQIIYSSHSPTLVSRIGINAINLLYENNHRVHCYPLSNACLNDTDKDYLEKYFDVTKSQMLFAKGILFVEGISEALLLPEMAKLLKRPLNKFAVELVNVDGTSFAPFANIITLPVEKESFAKAAIITDDDRCTNNNDKSSYVSKDIDYDSDLSGLLEKIDIGKPSDRFNNIQSICNKTNIEICGAKKTFEYELALEENNIPYILDAIISEFPLVGASLKKRVECEQDTQKKALMIWLFIRTRDKAKGQVAQSLCRIIQKQIKEIEAGKVIEKPFVVPEYLAKAIYSVTEPKD